MKRRTYRKYWNLLYKEVFAECDVFDVPIEVTCAKIKRYRKIIQKLKSYHQILEQDYRSGYETYGYESIKNIRYNLLYISDRFHAAFRLAWLVNVSEEVEQLKLKETQI